MIHDYAEIAQAPISLAGGDFTIRVIDNARQSDEHVILEANAGDSSPLVPLVRVHSACMTGDVFGSLQCDCGEQLNDAIAQIARHGYGAVVYPIQHEGRGIGLAEKIKAYSLQASGVDTFAANLRLGHPEDARSYVGAAACLSILGMLTIRLLSANPLKENALRKHGVQVLESIPIEITPQSSNEKYLASKARWFESLPHGHMPATQGAEVA